MILAELEEIEAKLDAILSPPVLPPDHGTLVFEGENMSDVTVPNGTATQTATVNWIDANGDSVAAESPAVWSSSDSSHATVDDAGVVTLVVQDAAYSVSISADTTNNDGSVASATGTISVEAAPAPPAPEPVSGDITFS